MKMIDSSSPEAKCSPDGDQRTVFTTRWWRAKSDANSNWTEPFSVGTKYQIYEKINFIFFGSHSMRIWPFIGLPKHANLNRLMQDEDIYSYRMISTEYQHSKQDHDCAMIFPGLYTSFSRFKQENIN